LHPRPPNLQHRMARMTAAPDRTIGGKDRQVPRPRSRRSLSTAPRLPSMAGWRTRAYRLGFPAFMGLGGCFRPDPEVPREPRDARQSSPRPIPKMLSGLATPFG